MIKKVRSILNQQTKLCEVKKWHETERFFLHNYMDEEIETENILNKKRHVQ